MPSKSLVFVIIYYPELFQNTTKTKFISKSENEVKYQILCKVKIFNLSSTLSLQSAHNQ